MRTGRAYHDVRNRRRRARRARGRRGDFPRGYRPHYLLSRRLRQPAHLFRRNGAPIVGSGSFDADSVLPDATRFGNESGAYNYGAQAAQVQVDPETGQVKILQFAVASDCGTVIYPLGAEGQVEGGLAQGIGYALIEGLQIDEGRPMNPNFSDYRIPSMRDMPPLQHTFADSYEPTGPFGAKGLGELNMDIGR